MRQCVCIWVHFLYGGVIFPRYIVALSKVRSQCIVYVATIVVDIYVCRNYNRFDMYLADTYNPIVYFISSLLTSVSVLLLCKQTFGMIPSMIHGFIRTISRGTMLIVGTHYILLKVFSKLLPTDVAIPFDLKMIITFAFVIVYFILIKHTFKRFPILYGKGSSVNHHS